jgi:AraC family transcriptional regulator
MHSLFCKITEENKTKLNKPVNTDMVYYSELNEWHTTNAFRSFSLKYVVEKCIYYKSGSKEYTVPSGNFLLACKQPDVKAYFDSVAPVKSICIDIRPETMAEAFTVMCFSGENNFDNFLAGYFHQPHFFEAVCPATDSVPFTRKLNDLVSAIQFGNAGELVNKEWFLDLAEKIVYHEFGNYRALNGIHSVKTSTKKELLCRLKTARQFMDDNFLQVSEIAEVASAGNLSEFHFYRSFKQAFGITPYHYLLHKRLELAKKMLRKKEFNVTEIALHCNFPDLPTFSKAFKKNFGISPSQF